MTRTFSEWLFGMQEKGLETIVTAERNEQIRVLEDKAEVHFRHPHDNRDLYGTALSTNQAYQFVPYREGTAALLYIDGDSKLNVVSCEGNKKQYKNVKDVRMMQLGDKTLVATKPVSVDDLFSQRNGAEVVHTSDFRLSIQCHEIGEVVNTQSGAYLPLRFGEQWKYLNEKFNYHTEIPETNSLNYRKVANG